MASLTNPNRKSRDQSKKGGRPAGSKNKTTMLAEAIKGDFEKSLKANFRVIMNVLIEKAKEGDMQAIKMLLDKSMPNAQHEQERSVKDYGINITISDMSSKEIVIEGEQDV